MEIEAPPVFVRKKGTASHTAPHDTKLEKNPFQKNILLPHHYHKICAKLKKIVVIMSDCSRTAELGEIEFELFLTRLKHICAYKNNFCMRIN